MKVRAIFFIVAFVLISAGSAQAQIKPQPLGDFDFAFLTDIHLMPELEAVKGFRTAIDTINKLKPDFVLTGGDLVHDVLDQSYGRSDSLYNLYETLAEEFDMPVFNTIGNHEVYGWHRDEEGIEQHPEFGKQMYMKRFGRRYYSFNHKGWHFIVLDGMSRAENGHYTGRIDQEQMDWIKADLEKTSKQTPIVISSHIPFLTSQTQLTKGALAGTPAYLAIENNREVLMLFWEHKLKLVLQGHLHFLEDIHVNNQVHFITGGAVSGKWWHNPPDDPLEEGFLMLHVKGEDFSWDYVDYGWTPPVD